MATPTAKPWTPAQERMGTFVIRYMSRANKWLYWLTGGWLGGTFSGAPVMFLTTVILAKAGIHIEYCIVLF